MKKQTTNKIDKSGIDFTSFVLSNYSNGVFTVIGWHDKDKRLIIVKNPANQTIVMDTLFSKTFRHFSGFRIID
jgi:hypothetical protein